MADVSKHEPDRVVAGDTWRWRRDDLAAEYPATDGWALTYILLNETGKITFTASADGDGFLVDEAAADTVERLAGTYRWEAAVSRDGDRFRVGTGTIEVQPNFSAAETLDTRSHARKVLAAIEAVIERRATKDQEEYTIEGRSLKRTPIAELIALRDRYRREVISEKQNERTARGLGSGRLVKVRFKG
ncbi:MAG: hypothetical protein QNJ84_11870 [Alphaproteobacteria bacterium]|nr:hypothetical protein [Alphaproteobacteria bacterium]